jgi:hypothetical protein
MVLGDEPYPSAPQDRQRHTAHTGQGFGDPRVPGGEIGCEVADLGVIG